MTPINSDQKQSILERINFMQVELQDLIAYKNINWEIYQNQREKRRSLERIIENLANASIDICKILLAGETLEIPGTYQAIVIKVGELGIINKNIIEQIAKLAKTRNVLAHQYLDMKWDLIKDLIIELPQVIPQFIAEIKI